MKDKIMLSLFCSSISSLFCVVPGLVMNVYRAFTSLIVYPIDVIDVFKLAPLNIFAGHMHVLLCSGF